MMKKGESTAAHFPSGRMLVLMPTSPNHRGISPNVQSSITPRSLSGRNVPEDDHLKICDRFWQEPPVNDHEADTTLRSEGRSRYHLEE
ncbi:hypothetical protein ACOMHN_053266 [Nucella lapillus]